MCVHLNVPLLIMVTELIIIIYKGILPCAYSVPSAISAYAQLLFTSWQQINTAM